jgi:hypothetical protein
MNLESSKPGQPDRSRHLRLRVGEWVEVRSKEEILATLDERGCLDQLPFMPEMFQHCGQRFRVYKRAHKTCDTVNKTGGRRMEDAVHLEGNRCDGSGHDGCEAACLTFWKEAWLRRVSGPSGKRSAPTHANGLGGPSPGARRLPLCTEQRVAQCTRLPSTGEGDPTYVCQATALPRATRYLPWWDLRQYVEDCTSGNATLPEMLGVVAYVAYTKALTIAYRSHVPERVLRRIDDAARAVARTPPFPEMRGTRRQDGKAPPSAPLGLAPGDVVRVKPHAAIRETLDANNRHRGMYFGTEDVPHCQRQFTVRSKVTKIVSEHTGKMIHLKGNNLILEGAWCRSHYSDRRRLCPRSIYVFWREDWLEPTSASVTAGRAANGSGGPKTQLRVISGDETVS